METKQRHTMGPQFPKDPPDDLYPQDKGRELLGSFIVELRRLADHAELRARCEHTDDDVWLVIYDLEKWVGEWLSAYGEYATCRETRRGHQQHLRERSLSEEVAA